MGLNFEFIGVAAKAGIACIPTTLLLALVPFIVGTIAGTVIAMVQNFPGEVPGAIVQDGDRYAQSNSADIGSIYPVFYHD